MRDRLFGVRLAVLGVIALGYSAVTLQRVQLFRSELYVWTAATRVEPTSVRAWTNLGRQYALLEADALAAQAYRHAVTLADTTDRAPRDARLGRAMAEINMALLLADTTQDWNAVTRTWAISAHLHGDGNPQIDQLWQSLESRAATARQR